MVSSAGLKLASQQTTNYGKHKIPRFIYHMTTKENYEAMLKDGFIRQSCDISCGSGVFTFELSNLFKRWNKSCGTDSFIKSLIDRISKGVDDIVILKIPTAKLNKDMLKIRSQNIQLDWSRSDNYEAARNAIMKAIENSQETEETALINIAKQTFRNFVKQNEREEISAHILGETPAKNSHLFKQRKHAIEYIYNNNIPISDIEKIGECNLTELKKTSGYDPLKPMRSLFTTLLSKTSEVKAAELINY